MAVDGYRISETRSGSSQEVKDKKTYSVHEIAQILQISRSKAYELCRQPDFKVVRLGRTIRISKASFDDWLNNLL
ncbi:helix-turn-helix domain-containing protein [Lachnospiraceae bacterium 38-10]